MQFHKKRGSERKGTEYYRTAFPYVHKSGKIREKRQRNIMSDVKDSKGIKQSKNNEVRKERLLLHSCCGPCSTAGVEMLVQYYKITVFFFNPCITNVSEYQRRKESQLKFISEWNREEEASGRPEDKINFIEGDYDPALYFRKVRGLENEPEGGARCGVCFAYRLTETRDIARKEDIPFFTTTLTVSSHKDSKLISLTGRKLTEEGGPVFLDIDFKKNDGFGRSVRLSKEYGLYRQDYCGCLFSKTERERQKAVSRERRKDNVGSVHS